MAATLSRTGRHLSSAPAPRPSMFITMAVVSSVILVLYPLRQFQRRHMTSSVSAAAYMISPGDGFSAFPGLSSGMKSSPPAAYLSSRIFPALARSSPPQEELPDGIYVHDGHDFVYEGRDAPGFWTFSAATGGPVETCWGCSPAAGRPRSKPRSWGRPSGQGITGRGGDGFFQQPFKLHGAAPVVHAGGHHNPRLKSGNWANTCLSTLVAYIDFLLCGLIVTYAPILPESFSRGKHFICKLQLFLNKGSEHMEAMRRIFRQKSFALPLRL
jgi:hypothetical protein